MWFGISVLLRLVEWNSVWLKQIGLIFIYELIPLINWNYQSSIRYLERNPRSLPSAQDLPKIKRIVSEIKLSSSFLSSRNPVVSPSAQIRNPCFTNFDLDTETLLPLTSRMESRRFSLSRAPETSAPPPLTGSPSSSGPVELHVNCALWLELAFKFRAFFAK